jgi:hypothetical protein
MTGELGCWSYLLIFAASVIVLGLVGTIIRHNREPWLTRSLILQGVLVTCVAGAFFREYPGDLRVASLVIVGLLVFQSVWRFSTSIDETSHDGDNSA